MRFYVDEIRSGGDFNVQSQTSINSTGRDETQNRYNK